MSSDNGAQKIFGPSVIDSYRLLLAYQFGGALLLVVGIVIALLLSYVISKYYPPFHLLVMFCGMLGAFFSGLTRLSKIDDAIAGLDLNSIGFLGARYLVVYSFVPPLVGAIAAVVIYMAFAGDFLQGGLFPKFGCKVDGGCKYLYEIIYDYTPVDPKDYAKAIVWAFIAGFSERLVPNVLNQIAKQKMTSSAD
jgi:hypothetical protein